MWCLSKTIDLDKHKNTNYLDYEDSSFVEFRESEGAAELHDRGELGVIVDGLHLCDKAVQTHILWYLGLFGEVVCGGVDLIDFHYEGGYVLEVHIHFDLLFFISDVRRIRRRECDVYLSL